jgi:hypothetical protein
LLQADVCIHLNWSILLDGVRGVEGICFFYQQILI